MNLRDIGKLLSSSISIKPSTLDFSRRTTSIDTLSLTNEAAISLVLNSSKLDQNSGLLAINRAISSVSMAESAIDSLGAISARQLEIAEKASSSALSGSQLEALQAELNKLTTEYNRIVKSTDINGNQLFDTSSQSVQIQISTSIGFSIPVSFGKNLTVETTTEAPGTVNTISTTSGGAGEQTIVTIMNMGQQANFNSGREHSTIELSTLSENGFFSITTPEGTTYSFEFVSESGEPIYSYNVINYEQSWLQEGNWEALGNAVQTAINAADAPFVFYQDDGYDPDQASYSYSSTIHFTSNSSGNTSDITGDGISVGTVLNGSSGNNSNRGHIQFQAADGTNYYVWLNTYAQDHSFVDSYSYFGSDPMLSGTGIRVDIAWSATNEDLAAQIAAAISTQTSGKVTASASGSSVTIKNTAIGNSTNASKSFDALFANIAGIANSTSEARQNITEIQFSSGATFTQYVEQQEQTVITLLDDIYQPFESESTQDEETVILIGAVSDLTIDDYFVIYSDGTPYYFDFEIDGVSAGSGYNHISINSYDSENEVASKINDYFSTYFSTQFRTDFLNPYSGELIILSNSSGRDESDSYYYSANSSFSTYKLSDGNSYSYSVDPDLGGFLVTDRNGNTYSFWLNYNGSTSSNPNPQATYSYEVVVQPYDSRNTVINNLAGKIDEAIYNDGADFTFYYDSDSIYITQNNIGDVDNVQVSFSQEPHFTSQVTQQGADFEAISGLYSTFSTPSTTYYTWFNVDGVGSDPLYSGTGIRVNISSSWNADQVASATASAINLAVGGASTASALANKVTITSTATGAVMSRASNGSATAQLRAYDITPGTNALSFTSINHGMNTGDRVKYTSTGAAFGGLTSESDYYIIRTSAHAFRLASSYSNAMAGTALSITSAGTGTQRVTQYDGSSSTESTILLSAPDISTKNTALEANAALTLHVDRIEQEKARISDTKKVLFAVVGQLNSGLINLPSVSILKSISEANLLADRISYGITRNPLSAIFAQANIPSQKVSALLFGKLF